MKKKDITIGSILFWTGIIVLLLWALGKSIGIIHSPIWVEMIPYFAVGGSLVGGGIKIGQIITNVETICKDMTEVKNDIKEIHKNAICLSNKEGSCLHYKNKD